MKLIEKYAYRKLRKMSAAVARNVKLPDPECVRKVAVLWQPEEKDAFQYLQNHFSGSGVIFRNICIYAAKPAEEAGANTVTPKDLDWLGFPRHGLTDDFTGTDFDLLLNIALKQNFVLDYLTALSRAKFKIGWSPEENNFFDLNINIGGNKNSLYLAEQQIFYLRQLNKKNDI